MLKLSLTSILMAVSFAGFVADGRINPSYAGYCPGQPGGKCPTPKKISKSRNDFTPEQREKIMANARQVCVKAYGASSTVYRFDYKKWRVICYRPGM